MPTKKNFYVVRKGRAPGIYLRWSGTGGAEEQVKGFAGAVFQGFASREEAEYYLQTGSTLPSAPVSLKGLSSAPAKSSPVFDYQEDLAAGKVVIFTDGASTGNPGPGGYGVVLLYEDMRKELSGGYRCTTNNRMELLACIVALREIKRTAPVVLYSDSRYVVDAVEKGWARRWRNSDWMRAPGSDGTAQRAENTDLWAQMLDLLDRLTVDFQWVRGHANHPENERCDQLAVQAAHAKNLPVDPGFSRKC